MLNDFVLTVVDILASENDITVTFDGLEPAKAYFMQVITSSRSKRSNSNLFNFTTERKLVLFNSVLFPNTLVQNDKLGLILF